MIKYLEKNYEEEITDKLMLIDFYADWCGPCKMQAEVFENVKDTIGIDILKIDVDKFPELAQNFNVFSIPTLFLIEKGDILKSHTGYLNPTELTEFINQK